MLEAIREMGKKILGDNAENLLDNLIREDLSPEIKGKKQHLVIINYRIFDKTIDIDFEEISDNTARKYLWVGNADAANSPQKYLTTNNLSYLLSQTIPNLIEITKKHSLMNNLLTLSLSEMFKDLEFSGRNRYLIDWAKVNILGEKLNIFSEVNNSLKKEYDEYTKLRKTAKEEKKEINDKEKYIFEKLLTEIESKILEIIKSKKHLTKKEIRLYTLKINDKLMVEEKEYQDLIVKEKIDSLFAQDRSNICSCCNENKPFTDSPRFAKAKSALGCYITDKVGFSSNLSGAFSKNFILCQDCYKMLLVGEIFIRNNLYSRLGGLDLYIIPQFLQPVNINSSRLAKWAEYISGTFNSAKSLRQLKEFENKLDQYRDFELEKNSYIINLLFWKKGTGAETKVLKLIKDVPPTRLELLKQNTNEAKDIGDRLLGQSNQWMIDMQTIYFLIPLRKSQNNIEYRKILSLYDSIFTGKPVSYSFLIRQFVELAQVYRFKRAKAYNVTANAEKEKWDEKKWYSKLINAILNSNLFLLYLLKLKLLKEGEDMDYNNLPLKEEIKQFIKEMKYDNKQKIAMFLLGYLIGEIGNAQSKLTDSHAKPILNKINFEGMNPNKLIRLTNEVFEKMNQYKVFSKKENARVPLLFFNIGLFNEYKTILDKEITNWDLSDQENVFYVLSGYAYVTHRALKHSKESESKSQDKEEVKTDESKD